MPNDNSYSSDQESVATQSQASGFRPHNPEKFVQFSLSLREVAIIQKIRSSTAFAKLLIIKQNNVIVRIEPTESVHLDENGLKGVVSYKNE